MPKQRRICIRCQKPIKNKNRYYCDRCLKFVTTHYVDISFPVHLEGNNKNLGE